MKRSLACLLVVLLLLANSQAAHAGAAGIDSLTFPGADSLSCGTWRVEGQVVTQAPLQYQLTDGSGKLLFKGSQPDFAGDGIIFAGLFGAKPTRNPITFHLGGLTSVKADNPCLPSSGEASGAIPAQALPDWAHHLVGNIVFSSFGKLYTMSPDGVLIQPLLTSFHYQINDNQLFPIWSPDKSKIAFVANSSDEDQILVKTLSNPQVQHLTTSHAHKSQPVWSPDGKRLAFSEVQFSTTAGVEVLYTVNADGTKLKRLTNNNANELDPAWSPDGQRLVFWSDVNQQPGLYIINADGSESRLIHKMDNGLYIDPSWSPNGTTITFSEVIQGQAQVYSVNPDGSQLQQLTSSGDSSVHPIWSPDGKHIAFARGQVTGEACDASLYVMLPDGSNPTALTDQKFACGLGVGSISLSWSPDSQHIAFASLPASSDGSSGSVILVASLDGTDAYAITDPALGATMPNW